MSEKEHPNIHIETGEHLSPRTPKNRNIKTPSGKLEVWPEWLVEELEEHLKSPIRQEFMERTISQTENQLNSSLNQESPNNDSSEESQTKASIPTPIVEDTQNDDIPVVTKQEISLFGSHPYFGLGVIGLMWGFIVQLILNILHFPVFQHQLFCVCIVIIPSIIIWLIILQMDNMLYKSINSIKVNNVDYSSI